MSNLTNTAKKRTSVLAALLAENDNIRVVHSATASTASFDLTKRTLTLPMWKTEKVEVYDFLVGHEVSHALHTPATGWTEACVAIGGEKGALVAKHYLNIVEDARIERLIKQKYPGLRKDFIVGYHTLVEMDLFGLKGMDPNQLPLFIDRINIHFKAGIHTGMQILFSEDEQVFVDRIVAARTFEQVVEITKELFDLAKQQKQEEQDSRNEEQNDNYDNDDDEDSEDGEWSDSDSPDCEYVETEDDTLSNQPKEATVNDDAPTPDGTEEEPLNIESGETDETDTLPETPETAESFHNISKRFVEGDYNEEVIAIGEIDINKVVISHQDFMVRSLKACYHYAGQTPINGMSLQELLTQHGAKLFAATTKSQATSVDFLVRQFELRRAAKNFARESQSKTGRISPRLLSKYKFSEEIFDRITIKRDEKNHGIVILLDWSGSMANILRECVDQLVGLLQFCRKAGIPAQCYFFTTNMIKIASDPSLYKTVGENGLPVVSGNPVPAKFTDAICNLPEGTVDTGGYCTYLPFSLVQVYDADMSNKSFQEVMGRLLVITESNTLCYTQTKEFVFTAEVHLGDSPIDEAFVAMNGIIAKFRKSSNTKICLLSITDGEGRDISALSRGTNTTTGRYTRKMLVSGKTGRRYGEPQKQFSGSHTAVVQMLKDSTGAKVVGIMLSTHSTITSSAMYDRCSRSYYKSNPEKVLVDMIAIHKKTAEETSVLALPCESYDQYFFVGVKTKREISNGDAKDADKIGRIKNRNIAAVREFAMSLQKESVNRVFLKTLMGIIA